MHNWNEQLDGLIGIIETMRKRADHRELIAIAGPPGSGKTTLAKTLADRLAHCSYLSMDGFHLDNPILIQKGLRERKGAPETFDVGGFKHLLQRLRKKEEVYVPDFDRQTERTERALPGRSVFRMPIASSTENLNLLLPRLRFATTWGYWLTHRSRPAC